MNRRRARLQQMIANPGQYRLLDRNCENFANWVATGTGKSDQINALALVSAVALIAAASQSTIGQTSLDWKNGA
jgi:hypothetical protein